MLKEVTKSCFSVFSGTFSSTLEREVRLFLRQRSRVIGALATPLLFWMMLGFGVGSNFKLSEGDTSVDYMSYFLPGTVLMVALFTAIFATITIIEDRKSGFLQGVLVSPASRSGFVLGKTIAGAILAMLQSLLIMLAAPFAGIELTLSMVLWAIPVLFLAGLALTTLGLCIAWPLDSSAAYHSLMNVVLLPLWFLSGAIFPLDNTAIGMKYIMLANPLTHIHALLLHALDYDTAQTISLAIALPVALGSTAVLFLLARQIAKRS